MGVCVLCLDSKVLHTRDNCHNNVGPCKDCGGGHNRTLCGATGAWCNAITSKWPTQARQPAPEAELSRRVSKEEEDKEKVLDQVRASTQQVFVNTRATAPTAKDLCQQAKVYGLIPVQSVNTPIKANKSCTVFFDTGATISIMRKEWARKAGLKGKPMDEEVITVRGDCKTWKTETYNVPLLTRDGRMVEVLAMGMDQVTESLHPVDHRPGAKLFPGVDPDALVIPEGKVDLLIGIKQAEVFPREIKRIGSLRLMESQFGSGYLLDGAHELVRPCNGGKFSHYVASARAAQPGARHKNYLGAGGPQKEVVLCPTKEETKLTQEEGDLMVEALFECEEEEPRARHGDGSLPRVARDLRATPVITAVTTAVITPVTVRSRVKEPLEEDGSLPRGNSGNSSQLPNSHSNSHYTPSSHSHSNSNSHFSPSSNYHSSSSTHSHSRSNPSSHSSPNSHSNSHSSTNSHSALSSHSNYSSSLSSLHPHSHSSSSGGYTLSSQLPGSHSHSNSHSSCHSNSHSISSSGNARVQLPVYYSGHSSQLPRFYLLPVFNSYLVVYSCPVYSPGRGYREERGSRLNCGATTALNVSHKCGSTIPK